MFATSHSPGRPGAVNKDQGDLMKFGKSRLFALAAAHGASLLSVPAVLQAATTSGQLEEIVVTARQREEKIEDVPVSITAFTAKDIQRAGIDRPQDFIALTPGVSQVQTAEVGDMQVSIRGINTGRDAETNFALVVDGVLQTNPNALNQELANVTQIEILKGPQGALYGRNAVAGAMIITTRKPGDAWQTDVGLGYGTDNSYRANLYVGGPITDSVRGSVYGYTASTDGQWHNVLDKCTDCVDFQEETGVLGRLMFPLAGGAMDLKARWSTVSAGAINFNGSIALSDVSQAGAGPAFYENPNDHNFRYINNIKPQNEQDNVNLSLKGDWDVGIGTLTAWVAYNDQTNYFLTDGTSAAFNLYTFNLKNNPAQAAVTCQQTNDARLTDPGYEAPFFAVPSSIWFTPAVGGSGFLPPYGPTTCDGYQYQQRNQTDTSFEMRLTSPGDDRLRWLGGVYYADISRDVTVAQGSDQNIGLQAKSFVPSSGPNPTDLLYDDTFDSSVYAVFGQLAYDVLDNLEVALALRYDSEDRKVNNHVPTCSASNPTACRSQTFGFNFYGNPYINPAYTATPSYAADGIPDRSKTFSELQPKLSVNWKLTDDVALFGSYGYGFRSGGFNSSGTAATIAQAYQGKNGGTTPLCLGASFSPPPCGPNSTFNITDVNDTYNKEVSRAGEVGFKSFFAERSVALNGALFYTDVDDMQFFNFFAGPFGLLRAVTNIDKVTIKGAEADFRWIATEGLSIFGGVAYVDGEIDKYTGRPYTKGNNVPYAPDYTGNLGAEYIFPIGANYQLLTRLDGTFVGETWFHPVQDERVPNLFTYFGFGQGTFNKMKRDAYATVNLRFTLQADAWSLTAWGRNIGDTEYLAEIIPAPEFGGSFIHNAPGDSYGVEMTYKFGR
jgi:iron complex outermembrane receptor protein